MRPRLTHAGAEVDALLADFDDATGSEFAELALTITGIRRDGTTRTMTIPRLLPDRPGEEFMAVRIARSIEYTEPSHLLDPPMPTSDVTRFSLLLAGWVTPPVMPEDPHAFTITETSPGEDPATFAPTGEDADA